MAWRGELLFAGSEVSVIDINDGLARIRFAVAAWRSSDPLALGAGDQRGFISGVEMVCLQPDVFEHASDALGAVHEGQVWLDGARCALVPVPCDLMGEVLVELVFANGATCRLTGRGLSIQPSADSRHLEWLSC